MNKLLYIIYYNRPVIQSTKDVHCFILNHSTAQKNPLCTLIRILLHKLIRTANGAKCIHISYLKSSIGNKHYRQQLRYAYTRIKHAVSTFAQSNSVTRLYMNKYPDYQDVDERFVIKKNKRKLMKYVRKQSVIPCF